MTKLSRRGFLKGSVALGAGFVLYRYAGGFRITNAQAGAEVRQLRIVHTNDHHSRIEPAPNVSIRSGTQTATRNLGGVARRKTLFDGIRGEATGTADKLFLDAGDVFQGTLYFNQYLGKADRYFYNRLGYAAQAIGNHDFDRGDQVLADYIAGVPITAGDPLEPIRFPLVSTNMTAEAASPLAALFQLEVTVDAATAGTDAGAAIGKWCHRVIVNMPSGEKVGIVGLTTVETKNIAQPSEAITFDPNYASVLNTHAAALRAAGCGTVIALTHIGFDNDMNLAAQLSGVNLIVGGHSHTPLLPDAQDGQPVGAANVETYPQIVTGTDDNPVVVVQDWEWAKWVGDITIGFDAAGVVTEVKGATILPVWADGLGAPPRTLLVGEGADIGADPDFQTAIGDANSGFKAEIAELEATPVGTTTVNLSNALSRSRENVLGNLLADAIRAKVATFTNNPNNLPVVCILNGGGIRNSIPAGAITVGQVLQVQPFGNTVGQVDVTGKQLKAALENGVSALQPGATLDAARAFVGTGRFPNVSGLRYTVNPNAIAAQPALAATATQPAVPAQPGRRITEVEVLVGDEYVPLVMDDVVRYRVATLSFIIGGGDGYSVFSSRGDLADPTVGAGVNRIDSGLIDADVTIEYIQAQPQQTISPELEGRITVEYLLKLPIISNLGDRAAAPAAIAAD
jgi:5'-nucleotidase